MWTPRAARVPAVCVGGVAGSSAGADRQCPVPAASSREKQPGGWAVLSVPRWGCSANASRRQPARGPLCNPAPRPPISLCHRPSPRGRVPDHPPPPTSHPAPGKEKTLSPPARVLAKDPPGPQPGGGPGGGPGGWRPVPSQQAVHVPRLAPVGGVDSRAWCGWYRPCLAEQTIPETGNTGRRLSHLWAPPCGRCGWEPGRSYLSPSQHDP